MTTSTVRTTSRPWKWALLAASLAGAAWWLWPSGGAPAGRTAGWAAGADPDDILVDLVDTTDDAAVARLERELGVDLELVSDQALDERFYRAHVPADRRDALLAALARRAEVELAEPDAEVAIPEGAAAPVRAPETAWEGFPDDPKFRFQWHLRQIGMPEAWKLEDGDGVVVAVLDTGVAYEQHGRFHLVEDLDGIEFVAPYDFVDNDAHANDEHAHGTHVAGTIAQRTHNGRGVAGVARAVKIMPLKVLGADGRGSVGGIADAIRYAADEGADVINMSLGGPFPSRALKKAVEYAHRKGVVIVAAAGNESRTKVGYPAAYPGVIAVASTQYDEATAFYSNSGKDVDVAAPGGNTRIDQNGDGMPDGVLQNTIAVGDPTRSDYFAFMGTSMASPHVAGVAALVVASGVRDPDVVEQVLEQTARPPRDQAFDRARYGAGIVDAPAAIRRAREIAGAAAHAADGGAPTPARTGLGLALGLLVAGAVAAAGRRGLRLGPGYLAGVGAAVATFAAVGVTGLAGLAPVQSAALPVAALALGFGVARLRGPLAGVAAGTAGHLLALLFTGADLRWVPSVVGLDALWLALNAGVCAALARVAVRR